MDWTKKIMMARKADGSPMFIYDGYFQRVFASKDRNALESEYLRLLSSGYIEMTPAEVAGVSNRRRPAVGKTQ